MTEGPASPPVERLTVPHPDEDAIKHLSGPQRIQAIDVVRGVALLGIFLVNMQSFSMPFMRFVHDPDLPTAPFSEQAAKFFISAFCEYKFVSTFSLLFGAGLAIQFLRAAGSGRSFGALALRRLVALAGFGLLHALFLWYGDILFIYACIGWIMIFAVNWSPKTLFIVAACLVGLALTCSAGSNGMQAVMVQNTGDYQPTFDPNLRGAAAIVETQFNPTHPGYEHAEIQAYRNGPWIDEFTVRGITWLMIITFTVVGFGWHIAAMFMIGAALLKLNYFSPDRRALQLRVGVAGLLAGLAVEIPAGIIAVQAEEFSYALAAFLVTRELSSIALCLGYVSIIAWLVNTFPTSPFFAFLARGGRMALTVYLGETLISTFLMYSWGLGWFNDVSRVQQIGLVLAIYTALMVLANLWLSFFTMGPLEWLWRCITYWRLQPIRRTA